MDSYTLMFIPWGYQIMVTSIDNMILTIIIFVLEIVEFAYFKRRAVAEGDLMPSKGDASRTDKQFLKKVKKELKVMGAMDDDDNEENDSSVMARLHNPVSITEEDMRALESLYLTKDGLKKSAFPKPPKNPRTNSSLRKSKYVDDEEQNLGTSTMIQGRMSQPAPHDKKSNEAKLLENIVKRLNEEQRLNQLHTEPASD